MKRFLAVLAYVVPSSMKGCVRANQFCEGIPFRIDGPSNRLVVYGPDCGRQTSYGVGQRLPAD